MSGQGTRRATVPGTEGDETVSAVRAAVYLRVSTGRQAEQELSIPDQKAQTRAWCSARGWKVVAEYLEPGASAMDDKRPEFQRMVERACDGENAFDVVIVHSFSRFFRDAFGLEFYVRKLAKHDVRLVSITQELGDDPAQVMMRQVIALFDEYQSKENAKHVIRAMKENARQGFWNGSRPPLGYRTVEAEMRGQRVKKRLVIDPIEAEQVRLMFHLFVEGDAGSGPMGIKVMANWLNAHGHRTRYGACWGVGQIHHVLTNPVYAGRLRFNYMDYKARRKKPVSEHVYSYAPAILDPALFDRAQTMLRARNPRVVAPRVVTGPILLTGLAHCAACGGAMTLRTGTSRTGDVYRYYSCATHARKGKSACGGRAVRMDKLDELVTNHLADRLLTPERLTDMLSALTLRRAEREAAIDERMASLEREATDAEARLRRLYGLVEDGITELDGTLKERIAGLKAVRDAAQAALQRLRSDGRATIRLGPRVVAEFAHKMREQITSGDITFRKAYLGAIVDRIEVDDRELRISGRKDVLEQAVIASAASRTVVRTFVPKWLGN